MSTKINEFYPIKSHVSLILRSKTNNFLDTTSVVLLDNTESLDIPECYDYLPCCSISTSTDICAYICARESIEEFLENENDRKIIPPLFCFYQKEISFSDLLENITDIFNESKYKSDKLGSIVQVLSGINPNTYNTDEQKIDSIMDMVSGIIGGNPFDYDLAKEIKVPLDPILISKIQNIYFSCRDMGIVDVWEWDPHDDAEEFAADSTTSPNTPHFQYLLYKWYKYKFDHHPALQYEENPANGLVLVKEFSDQYNVEEALLSGNIENLISSGWWEIHKKSYYFSKDVYHVEDSFNPDYEEDDGFSKLESYKRFLKLTELFSNPEFSDPVEFESELFYIDWDYLEGFWQIGVMCNAIDSASAEQTTILLNSEYLDLTDEEPDYLIDYAVKNGKTEHTACLLNYKNERDRSN